MMEVEEKSVDGKTVVEERKDEDEAKMSKVVDNANKKIKENDKQKKKINEENKKKEKIEDKEKEDSSPERLVKKERDTEGEGGSAKKKPISSFFGKPFFPILLLYFN